MASGDLFSYACEKCDNSVILTFSEYEQRQFKKGKYGARIVCDTCNAPPAPEPEVVVVEAPLKRASPQTVDTRFVPMGATTTMTLTPKERADYGVIVTIREQATMRTHTFSVPGRLTQALSQACEMIDAIPEGDWKIVTISNPISIFRDLQGSHDPNDARPEVGRLQRARRRDLLEILPHGTPNTT
jgi:hypothetical protein